MKRTAFSLVPLAAAVGLVIVMAAGRPAKSPATPADPEPAAADTDAPAPAADPRPGEAGLPIEPEWPMVDENGSDEGKPDAPAPAVVTPEPEMNPLNLETEARLRTPTDLELTDSTLLDVLEHLRAQAGVEFLYDPSVLTRLEATRVTLSLKDTEIKAALDFIREFSGFRMEYLNGKVWIRPGEP